MMEKREIDQEDLLGIGIDEHATPSVQTPAGGNKGGFTDDLLNIGLNDEGSSMSHSPNNFNFGSQKQKNGDFGGLEDFMEVTSPVTSNSTLVGKNPLVEVLSL